MNIKQILFICVTSVGSLVCLEHPSLLNQLDNSLLQQNCIYWADQPVDESGKYFTEYPRGRKEGIKACGELNADLFLAAYGNKDLDIAPLTDDELREKMVMALGVQEDKITYEELVNKMINEEIEKYKTLREKLQVQKQRRETGRDPRRVVKKPKSREVIDTKQQPTDEEKRQYTERVMDY